MATQKAAAQKEVNVAQALRLALKAVTGLERTAKQLTVKAARQEALIERLKARGTGAGPAKKAVAAKKGPKARAAADDEDAPVRKGPKAKAGVKKVVAKKGPAAKKAAGVKKAPIKGAKAKVGTKKVVGKAGAKGKDTFLL